LWLVFGDLPVHRPADPQLGVVLVAVKDAARRCAVAFGHP